MLWYRLYQLTGSICYYVSYIFGDFFDFVFIPILDSIEEKV